MRKKALAVSVCLSLIAGLAVWGFLDSRQSLPATTVFPVPPVSGAAVFYHRAFEVMPDLDKGEMDLLSKGLKSNEPLEREKTAAILEPFRPSFKLLAEGAKESSCEWGLDLNRSITYPQPYLSKEIQLMQALTLQARLHLEEGDPSAAVDDLLLCMRFSRHIGQADLLINWMVHITGDMIPMSFAARNLPRFDASSLQKLADGIGALPPPRSFQSVISMGLKADAAHLRRLLLPNREALETKYRMNHIPALPNIRRLYLGWMLKRFESRSQELTQAAGIPFPEGKPQIDAFIRLQNSFKWTDIFSVTILPAHASACVKNIQMEAAWTIFQTALVTQIHNPARLRGELAKLRDPYDGGPLDCQEVKEGVKVVLKNASDRKSVSLTIGESGK